MAAGIQKAATPGSRVAPIATAARETTAQIAIVTRERRVKSAGRDFAVRPTAPSAIDAPTMKAVPPMTPPGAAGRRDHLGGLDIRTQKGFSATTGGMRRGGCGGGWRRRHPACGAASPLSRLRP